MKKYEPKKKSIYNLDADKQFDMCKHSSSVGGE